mmetsp:Transcript_53507/g.106165  ORF Transcript_53507/g.106165 Transcript_53507/m.106165 type:complete len:88 (-) Transcript_53507:846-1109(-)
MSQRPVCWSGGISPQLATHGGKHILIQKAALSLSTELGGESRKFKAVDFIMIHSKLLNHDPVVHNNKVATVACSADTFRALIAISVF